jgi:pimeloyl-ACP methyl ester carboxylesterase
VSVSRRELEVRCEDGRRLVVQAVGPEDGIAVLFHSGTPGSHHLFEPDLESAVARGVHHICYARPGYEGSDRMPGREIVGCVSDCEAIADALGIERFHSVGYSGGAPHALACGARAPQRVLSVVTIAGCAPHSALGASWLDGMGEENLAEYKAVEEGDAALERFLRDAVDELGSIEDSVQLVAAFGDLLCDADKRCLTGAFLEYQLEGCEEIADGDIWGWFDDDKATWGDWGFDPAEASVPVTIWHGAEDQTVPAAHARWLAENIPDARLRLLPGEGHFSLGASYYSAVLDDLIVPKT